MEKKKTPRSKTAAVSTVKLSTSHFGALHNLVIGKLSALEEFNQKMETIEKSAEELSRVLMSAAPPKLRFFLRGNSIVSNLMKFGRCRLKVYLPDADNKLGDFEQMDSLMSLLKDSWKHVVKIRSSTKIEYDDSNGRYEISLNAYNYSY